MSVQERLDALSAASDYAAEQEKLGDYMRQGFISLARARLHAGRAWCGADDCRMEIEPNATVAERRALGQEDAQLRLIRSVPASKGSSGSRDPALLFAALGPPDLRKAQKSFNEGLEAVVRMASLASKVLTMAPVPQGDDIDDNVPESGRDEGVPE